jgi:hypothetical protein
VTDEHGAHCADETQADRRRRVEFVRRVVSDRVRTPIGPRDVDGPNVRQLTLAGASIGSAADETRRAIRAACERGETVRYLAPDGDTRYAPADNERALRRLVCAEGARAEPDRDVIARLNAALADLDAEARGEP